MKFHHTIKKTQPVMMRKRKMTSGREFIYRHHVVPRVKLYVPKEEPFPVPLKYIDVTRTTHTSLDVLWRNNIEDYWNVDGEKESSDAWTGVHKIHLFERKATWWVHMVRVETDKKTNNLSSRWCMARYVEANVWCSEEESKTKMGYRETKARQYQTIERNILHRTRRWRVQAHNESRSEKVGSSDASSNALQNTDREQWGNPPQYWKRTTQYACVVNADESTRLRLEGAVRGHHQDHITEKGTNSMNYNSLVRKFILMPRALKLPDAKAAVEK